MATDPYLSKQSVGGLVERCVNTPPSRITITSTPDPFSSGNIGELLPMYWSTLKNARLGDEFIIENTAYGVPWLITAKCVMINTSGVKSIHFFCKSPKMLGNWNPTSLRCALDTETPFNTFELVISPTDSTQFTYGAI